MYSQLNNSFSFLHKFLIVVFCLLLVFTTVAKPITVHANAVAGVQTYFEIGAYGEVVQIAPYLLPFIVIFLGLDLYYSNIDEIVLWAETVYNNADVAIQTWAQTVYNEYVEGSSAFKLTQSKKDELNSVLELHTPGGKGLPPELAYLVFPAVSTFLTVNTIGSSDVFYESVVGAVGQTNFLLEVVIDTLAGLRRAINRFTYSITSPLNGFQASLDNLLYESGLRIQEYTMVLSNLSSNIDYRVDELMKYVRTEVLYAIREGYVGVDNVDFHVEELTTYLRTEILDNIRGVSTNITDSLSDLSTDLAAKIESIPGSIVKSISDLEVSFSEFRSEVITKFDTLIQAISNGQYSQIIQESLSPGIITNSFQGVLAGVSAIADFFGSGTDGGVESQPFWGFFDPNSSIWSFFADSDFIAALTSFFNFVAALWVLFPLGIRYLVMFGFCFPFMFAGLKMLVG